MQFTERLWATPVRVCALVLASLLALAGAPADATAHAGEAPTPNTIWSAWNWDPLLTVFLLAASIGYWRGTSRMWHGTGAARGVRPSQAIAFAVGMLLLVVAVISPLDALGESLFWAHMVQHLLLILVIAPLMVYSRPWLPILWALPRSWRVSSGGLFRPGRTPRRLLTILTGTVVVWVLHLIALWIWHIPLFYEAAIDSWLVHTLEHATFLATAMLFWWSVLPISKSLDASRQGLAVLALFTTALHSGLLSAILTFSASAWYTSHAATAEAWGFTPLEDQQLAGVIMWVPMGIVYTITAAAVLIRLLQRLDRDDMESWTATTVERTTESS